MSSFSSIHLNMIHNKSNYDLYLPSKCRQSCFVDIPIETEELSIKINPFKMLYNTDKDKYDALIDKFLNISPNMLFIGFSNSSAVFIEQGEKYIKFCNFFHSIRADQNITVSNLKIYCAIITCWVSYHTFYNRLLKL